MHTPTRGHLREVGIGAQRRSVECWWRNRLALDHYVAAIVARPRHTRSRCYLFWVILLEVEAAAGSQLARQQLKEMHNQGEANEEGEQQKGAHEVARGERQVLITLVLAVRDHTLIGALLASGQRFGHPTAHDAEGVVCLHEISELAGAACVHDHVMQCGGDGAVYGKALKEYVDALANWRLVAMLTIRMEHLQVLQWHDGAAADASVDV